PVRGHRLEMRAGLNAGEVLRQEIGSGHFGTPVVIASRLCGRAEAGQILTTGVVAALLTGRHAVRFHDLGPAQLKGLDAPVAVAEVLYESESPSPQAEAPTSEKGPIFAFEDFELDVEQRELLRAGTPVEIQLKPLELLLYLVRHADRTVAKQELLDQVWPGVAVSDAALSSALRDVRRVLGKDGGQETWIRTQRGKGYRFVPPVEERVPSLEAPGLRIEPERPGARALVGRHDPLNRLETALDEACRGRGKVILIGGEAGIGKTRLAQEIAGQAERRALHALWGRCWDGAGAPPFWPWIRILRKILQELSAEPLRRILGERTRWLLHVLPELADPLAGDVLPESTASSPDSRFRFYDAATTLLCGVGDSEPLLLVLDDLHWGDPASLELLRFLAAEIGQARVLVVATYRDVEVETGLALESQIANLLREDAVEQISLSGLSEEESLTLIARLVDHEPDPEFARALYERTNGNPFFLEETLRHLRETHEDGPDWTHDASIDAAGVPEGVRHVIEQRLSRLTDPCRSLLDVAAVVGSEFEGELAGLVEGVNQHPPAGVIDEATRAHLLLTEEAALPTYRFAHPLIRETLYAGLGPERRRELHHQVGEALEKLHGGDLEPPLAALAHHFDRAASAPAAEKALAYAGRAAHLSLARFAFEDAAAHFDRSLRLQERAGTPDPKLRCDLLLGLGEALSHGEWPGRATDIFRRALELARTFRAPESLARAAIGLEGTRWVTQSEPHHTHVPLLEEVMAALGSRDLALCAELLCRLAFALDRMGDPRAEAMSRDAVETARRSGDPEILGFALAARHDALWHPSRLEERLVLARQIAEVSPEARNQATASEWLFLNLLRSGDLAGAEEALETASRAAEIHRIPFRTTILRVYGGMLALLQGRFQEAERAALRTLRQDEALVGRNASSMAEVLLFSLRHQQGRLPEVLPALESALARMTGAGQPAWIAARFLALQEAGREQEAREALDRLAREGYAPGPGWNEPTHLALLMELCARLRHEGAAERLMAELCPYLPQNLVGGSVFSGSSCHYAGLLAHTLGRHAEAVRVFEDALEMHQRMAARPWIARTQAAQARALLERDAPGDGPAAGTLLDQALATARDLGMSGLAAEAEALLGV
ncbi:MAG: AAA family ATPase, partial [Myxococcota bacterium]